MTSLRPALLAKADTAATILLTVAVLVLLATGWAMAVARLMCDYPVGAVEPAVVVGVQRVTAGEVLYRDYAAELPLTPMTYGVLVYAVPGLAGRFLGTAGLAEAMLLARLPSALGSVCVSLLLYLLARRFGATRLTGLWAAGALASVPMIFEWSNKAAPDMPAIALSLFGWLLADGALRAGTRGRQLAWCACAAVVWAAAFHYKMIVLAGPLGFTCQVLLCRRDAWRLWLATGMGALVLALAGVAWLQSVTEGLYAANLVGSMAVCRYSPMYAATIISGVVEAPLAALGVALAAGLLLRSRHWLGAAVSAAFVLNFLLAGKQGANGNYFADTLALSGLALAAMPGWSARPAIPEWVRIAAKCLIAVGLLAMLPIATLFVREVRIPAANEYDIVAGWMASAPGATDDVLCLDPHFGMSRGVPYLYADSYHAGLLLSAGVGDVSAVVDTVNRQGYRCIVANKLIAWKLVPQDAPLAYLPLKQAVLEHYRPAFIGSWLIVFVPEVREPQ